MTATERLRQRLGQLPDEEREAMAARMLEKWDTLQWNAQSRVQAGKLGRSPSEEDAAQRTGPTSPPQDEPVPFERIEHLVGSIEGPDDLSTNPKYMEGFGKSARKQG